MRVSASPSAGYPMRTAMQISTLATLHAATHASSPTTLPVRPVGPNADPTGLRRTPGHVLDIRV